MRITTSWKTHSLMGWPLGFVFRLVNDPYYVGFLLTGQGCQVYEGDEKQMQLSTDLKATIDRLENNAVIAVVHDGMHSDMTVEPTNYTRRHAWTVRAGRRHDTFMQLVDHTNYTIGLIGTTMSLHKK